MLLWPLKWFAGSKLWLPTIVSHEAHHVLARQVAHMNLHTALICSTPRSNVQATVAMRSHMRNELPSARNLIIMDPPLPTFLFCRYRNEFGVPFWCAPSCRLPWLVSCSGALLPSFLKGECLFGAQNCCPNDALLSSDHWFFLLL